MIYQASSRDCHVRANAIPILVIIASPNLLTKDANCPFGAETVDGLCKHLPYELANESHLARVAHGDEMQHCECHEALRCHTELFTKGALSKYIS